MTDADKGERSSAPDLITTDRYVDHQTRIVRLEEFRKHHEKDHEANVATKNWVHRMGWAVVGTITVVSVGIATTLIRVWLG